MYNISQTSWLIEIKFYVKYDFGGGKVASGFGADWIKTLVSVATDSSHRTIMGKPVFSSFLSCFDPILFILACNADEHESLKELEFWTNQTTEYGVSCP